MSRVLGIYI